jgi:hypothetical protein
MNAKAVEMIVLATHHQLDRAVRISDRQAVCQPDPLPDRRMYVGQLRL